MTPARSKIAVVWIALAALVAVILWQEWRANRLKTEVDRLQDQISRLESAKQSLSLSNREAADDRSAAQDQLRELLRLRGEVAGLL